MINKTGEKERERERERERKRKLEGEEKRFEAVRRGSGTRRVISSRFDPARCVAPSASLISAIQGNDFYESEKPPAFELNARHAVTRSH